MASETTKYQVNFKTHKDGTLINIYADSIKELEVQITDISMIAALIKSTEAELYTGAGNNSNATSAAVAAISQSFNATPVAEPASVQSNGQAHQCRHGVMSYREGVGQKGPWKGYMCAAPKGAPDKCETIWVR
jgi:hypothetical protein